ncbi:alpha/beta-hydrolase [Acephala macrosclerotiorum]|nr:alpha/beta-hydrolase [Acephala macrosclerotiorum]
MTSSSDDPSMDDTPSKRTTIIPPTSSTHTHTIIFLHGREDYGSDLAKSFFDSKSSDGRSLAEIFPSVRWVFPTAKMRVSARREEEFRNSLFAEALKGEEVVSQWFDVWDLKKPEEREELMLEGLRESIEQIVEIVKEEMKLVSLDKILLGGISHGCATVMMVMLASGIQVGGFIGWCGWLPFRDTIDTKFLGKYFENREETSQCMKEMLGISELGLGPSPENDKVPVFLGHSGDDETVPFKLGEDMRDAIEQFGYWLAWKGYKDGGHWIHPARGVDDMAEFLHNFVIRGITGNIAEWETRSKAFHKA